MQEQIFGKWFKTSGRCERCGRAVKQFLVVDNGPTKGKFCGNFCFDGAREEMEKGEVDV